MKMPPIDYKDPASVERWMRWDVAEIHFYNSLKWYERECLFNILFGSIGTAWFTLLAFAVPPSIFLDIALAVICVVWTISGIVGWRNRRTKRMMMNLGLLTIRDQ